jgi:aminopeptidase N
MGYRINNAHTGSVAHNMIYPKGAFILHMIRMMMYDSKGGGDGRFIAMMRDFVKTHYNQAVSTEDFKAIVEKHMTPGMDLMNDHTMDWFFDEFVYGTEIPRYKLDYELQPVDDKFILKMHITQSEVSDNFRMLVPISFETEDRKLLRLGSAVMVGNSSQDVTVTLGFKPRRLVLCAHEDVLANIDGR